MRLRLFLFLPFTIPFALSVFAACGGDDAAPQPAADASALTCEAGKLDCNLVAGDGCESESKSDVNNCGACGVVCEGSTCENGKCLASGCGLPNRFECNAQPADGCETDISTSATSCGHCGHACAAGKTCADSTCTEDVLADDIQEPFGIALSADRVFFTKRDGKVGSVDKDGKTKPVFHFIDRNTPRAIAVDATYMYWLDEGDVESIGMVLRAKLDGTCEPATPCPVVLAETQNKPRALAIDATDVYWINSASGLGDATISKTPVAGGATTVLATKLLRPHSIKVDATHVYYSLENGGVYRMKKDGTESALLTAGTGVKGIDVDEGGVFYASNGRVYRTPKTGAKTPDLIASIASPVAVKADTAHVYFTVYNEVRRALRDGSCKNEGPCAQPIGKGRVSGIVDDVSNLATDGTYIYWANVYGKSIVRVEK